MESWQIFTHILSFILGGVAYHIYHIICKTNINVGNKGQSIQGSSVVGDVIQGDKVIKEEPKKTRIRITAKASIFSASAPPALTCFKLNNRTFDAFPKILEKEDIVEWFVPNTIDNLFMCQQSFEKGGVYSFEEWD